MVAGAKACGADRVELYTEAYAREYPAGAEAALAPYLAAAEAVSYTHLDVYKRQTSTMSPTRSAETIRSMCRSISSSILRVTTNADRP